MDIKKEILKIEVDSDSNRIDTFLSKEINRSRSFIKKLIDKGDIKIDGVKIGKTSHKVVTGNVIEVTINESTLDLEPENISLDIIYQDKDIVVINKQAGIVSHPGPGSESGTLVNALLYHIKDLSSIGGTIRPGIVHRLDKLTSGLMVIAKNDISHSNLSEQFKDRKVGKKYYAIVNGIPLSKKGRIENLIGRDPNNRKKMKVCSKGKKAISEYIVLESINNKSLLDVRIESGRTHQIRVHMLHMGNYVLGDMLYSKNREKLERHLLHCHFLSFEHPTKKEVVSFESKMPKMFEDIFRG